MEPVCVCIWYLNVWLVIFSGIVVNQYCYRQRGAEQKVFLMYQCDLTNLVAPL